MLPFKPPPAPFILFIPPLPLSASQEWPSLLVTSESGDNSEILWDVADRGVECPGAEAVAEGVAVV